MGRPPTVDGLRAAGDAAGGISAEIGNQVGHLLRFQQATDGSPRDHDLLYTLG